jgi:hypothetical protein
LEVGTSHFEVEHSTNGLIFNTLATAAALGNNGLANDYVHLHPNTTEGLHYYRIKQIDRNGTFVYSKTISVKLETGPQKITISPNPANHHLMLTLSNALKTGGEVQVVDMWGRTVLRYPSGKGAIQVRLDISKLASGSYKLLLITPSYQNVMSFVKW